MRRMILSLILGVLMLAATGCQYAARSVKYDGPKTERIRTPDNTCVIEIERAK